MSTVTSRQSSGDANQGAPLVMIVEDDDAQRRTLAAIIADAGFSPVSFADADAALSSIAQGAYAAAVIDQCLPGITGPDLISRLKNADPGIRIIVHTAYGSFDSIKESVNLGVFGYVEKGGQPNELLRKLQQAVQLRLSEVLRETEQRIAKIYAQANDGIFILDPTAFTIIDVNYRGANMPGYASEELTGNSIEKIHPYDLSRVKKFFRRVMNDGNGFTDEVSCMTKTGRIMPAECSAALIKDSALERVLVIVRDVSDRRRAERAVQSSEKQLRLIADNVSAMLAYVDVSHRYRFVNKRFIEFFKMSYDDVLGANIPEVVGESTYKKIAPYLDRALLGETVTFELERTSSQGETRWINATYVPDMDGSGAVRGCFAALHDVTERKLAEQDARDPGAQLQLIADNVGAMICYVGADYRYQFANRRFADFFGRSVEKVLGSNIQDIVGSSVYDAIHPYLERVFAGETVTFEQERRSPVLGARLIEATLVPDTAGDGTVRGYYGLLSDVTERRAADEALRKNEAMMRAIFEHSPVAINLKDSEGRYLLSQQEMGILDRQKHVRAWREIGSGHTATQACACLSGV